MAFYRIKDAAEKIGVQPHVLRFWEQQFPSFKPPKTSRGQRLYSDEDVENFLKIKTLLYNEGYSIPGAKKVLKDERQGKKNTSTEVAQDVTQRELLKDLVKELRDMRTYAKEI